MVTHPTSDELQSLKKAGKYHIIHSLVWELYDLGYKPKQISDMLELKHTTVRALINQKKKANEDQLTAISYTLDALRSYISIVKDEGFPKAVRSDLEHFIMFVNEILANTMEREELDEELEREINTPLQKIIQEVGEGLHPAAKRKLTQTSLEKF